MEIKNTMQTIQTQAVSSIKVKAEIQPQKDNKEQSEIVIEKVSKEVLDNKVETMNKLLESSQTSLRFQLHEQLKEYYVQVVDSTSNEVIKEIPQKKFLDMYASMAELMGLFVDDKF